jgi:hypothetical protein
MGRQPVTILSLLDRSLGGSCLEDDTKRLQRFPNHRAFHSHCKGIKKQPSGGDLARGRPRASSFRMQPDPGPAAQILNPEIVIER